MELENNQIINALLVGCGRISRKHFDALNDLAESGVQITAVVDVDTLKSQNLVKNKMIPIFGNLKDIPNTLTYDLGVVMTDSGKHYEHAKFFVSRGIDVLVEKPVTLKLEQAYELENLAREQNCKIYVVKQNRYNAAVQKARSSVDQGLIGRINIGTIRVRWNRPQSYYDQADWRGTWEFDGGVIANQASHHIDLLQWFMGPIQEVSAYDARFGVDIETENSVVAAVKFLSGALGTIEASTCIRPRNIEGSLSLIGELGTIEIGGNAVNNITTFLVEDMKEINELTPTIPINPNDVYGAGHKSVYQDIIKDRNGELNSAVEITESLKSLELIHMIYKSIEEGRPVLASEQDIRSSRLGVKNV